MSMQRPIYDTTTARRAEEEIGVLLKERWQLDELLHLLNSYVLDFACLRDKRVLAFVEVKDRRSLPLGFGEGMFVTLIKAMRAAELTRLFSVPCFLVVRFRGGEIAYASFDQLDMDLVRVADGRRRDRDDPFDREPFVTMPWPAFKLLEPLP